MPKRELQRVLKWDVGGRWERRNGACSWLGLAAEVNKRAPRSWLVCRIALRESNAWANPTNFRLSLSPPDCGKRAAIAMSKAQCILDTRD